MVATWLTSKFSSACAKGLALRCRLRLLLFAGNPLSGASQRGLSSFIISTLSDRLTFSHSLLILLIYLPPFICSSACLPYLNMTLRVAPSSKMPPRVPSFSHNQPFAQPFALCIKHVEYQDSHHRTPSPPQGPDFFWRPSISGRFAIQDTSDWWIWDPGLHQPYHHLQRLRPLTEDEINTYRPYKSCTMVWAPERQHYLHIPVDCTAPGQSPDAHVWKRLSFGYDEHPHRAHIAVIGHHRDHPWLRVPAPRHWFPQLLPVAYQSQEDITQRCGLAGELSILVGLIAFSTTPQGFLGALDQSFRPDLTSTVFRPHAPPEGPRKCSLQLMQTFL